MALKFRTNTEIDFIIGSAQETMGDLALKIVRYNTQGRTQVKRYKDFVYRIILLRTYLMLVIGFDGQIKPYLLLDDNQVLFNKILDVLVELSEVFDVGTSRIMTSRTQPIILAGVAVQGEQGIKGLDGSNANIIVRPKAGELQIKVDESGDSLLKFYDISLLEYTAPSISVNIQGSKLREIGDVVETLTVRISSTKGSENILTRVVTNPGGFSLVNANLNNEGAQSEDIIATNVNVDTTYSAQVTDIEGAVSDSDSITFVRPFLWGTSDSTSGFDHYAILTKLLESKGNKTVLFNAENKHFFFGYPASYGDLKPTGQRGIVDQNNFDAGAAFTKVTVPVSSQNLDNNWVDVDYIFYYTTEKTSINGNFIFSF